MAEVQTHTQAGEMTQVFIEFVMQQAQNAALFLGQIPDPRRGQVEINLPLAKMFIDQLAVVREKTRGNLNPDEKKVIDSAVSELYAMFAETAQMVKAQNVSAEIPPMPIGFTDAPEAAQSDAPAAPAPLAPPPAAAAPAPEPPQAAPPDAAPPKPAEPEESRKRFSKTYGS
jgi:Domain of unknown function (DUF1844)